MSKGKGKIIGALITAGIFGVGGVAGGIVLANTQMEQKVADAEDKGYQEGHKDGYEQGASENTGYTEEDLENAKDEGREEAENEYLTVLSILTSQDKQEMWVNENLCLYSTPSIPGLIAYNKTDKRFYTIKEDGYSYSYVGSMDGYAMITSSEQGVGLFGIKEEDLSLKVFTTFGYGYTNLNKFDDSLIATCRDQTFMYGCNVVKIKDNGEVEVLIQSQGQDLSIMNNIAYELNSDKIYIYQSGTFNQVNGMEGIWINYIEDLGNGLFNVKNSQGNTVILNTNTAEVKTLELSSDLNIMSIAYSYSTQDYVFSTGNNEVYVYNFSSEELEKQLDNVTDNQGLISSDYYVYFKSYNNSTGSYDFYGLIFGNEITKLKEGCSDVYTTDFDGTYWHVYCIEDGFGNEYKLNPETGSFEAVV